MENSTKSPAAVDKPHGGESLRLPQEEAFGRSDTLEGMPPRTRGAVRVQLSRRGRFEGYSGSESCRPGRMEGIEGKRINTPLAVV